MSTDSKMIDRLFFSLLPIQILMVAIASINGIVDGMMASNFIGPGSMAVTGLYMPVSKILETLNIVLLGGSQILCGQFLGKNQLDRTRGVFTLDILFITIVSALMTLIFMILPDRLAAFLGAEQSLRSGLTDYIRGISPGILPQLLGTQLVAFLQLERQEKRTYAGIFAMVLTNLSLDYIFIKVLGWSMLGLGLATTISYVVFFMVLGQFYFTRKAVIKIDFRNLDVRDLKPMVMIGIPGALVTFCLSIRGLMLNAELIRYSGSDGLSALSALNTCGYLLYAVTAGIAAATRLLVSVYVGEEDRASLIMVMKTALKKGVPIVCAAAAVVIALAGPITYLFYKDTSSNVFYLTEWLFRIFPLSMPLSAICVIFINYYQSSSRMGIVNVLSASDGILGIGAASAVLAPMYGAMGIWAAHVVNGIITTAIIVIYAWAVNRKAPGSIEDLMTIPAGFGVPDSQRLDISIHSDEDVVDTSGMIMEFCERHGVDRRRSYCAGLCMEEMASNVVDHGFSKDSRKHSVDVRVVYKDGDLILRTSDDCIAFDPKEKLALIDPEDVSSNIGLRMVRRLAKSMTYTNVLGMNVLTMTL